MQPFATEVNATYPSDVINKMTPLATESTEEHGNIAYKAFIFSCFPWIPWQNARINAFRLFVSVVSWIDSIRLS